MDKLIRYNRSHNLLLLEMLLVLILSSCTSGIIYPSDEFYIPPDELKALEIKAEQGDMKASEKLVNYYRFVEDRPRKVIQYLRPLAEEGVSAAQYILAYHLLLPTNNLKELKEGVIWLRRSANGGEVYAQEELARLYEGSELVETDYSKARFWYEKVAFSGDISSMIKLSDYYTNGIGGPKNIAKAYAWLLLAESKSHKDSVIRKDIKKRIIHLEGQLSTSDLTDSDSYLEFLKNKFKQSEWVMM